MAVISGMTKYPFNCLRVAFSDLAVSLLAGVAIFPAVFAFGYEPNAGPSLLFQTIPSVFASMPFGGIFMVIFFILTAIASIGAQISLVEVPVAFLEEKFHLGRKKAPLLQSLESPWLARWLHYPTARWPLFRYSD